MSRAFPRSNPGALPLLWLLLLMLATLAACSDGKAATEGQWTCPMHPDYVSDRPGECPICHMTLVPKGGAGTPAALTPSTAPTAIQVPESGLKLAGIETEEARLGEGGRTIRATATLVPDERRTTEVHTRISGWVETLHVNATGQLVRRGQPMLEIYSPEVLASEEELLRARAAQARFAGSSLPEVQQGAADLVAAARRRLTLLGIPESEIERLEFTSRAERTVTLEAPASGYVQDKQVFAGQKIEPETALFRIVDLSRVWLEGSFYEADAPAIRPGLKAKVTLPSDPGRSLEARATYLYPTLDPATRTLKVRFELANPGMALKPGMFADLELQVGEPAGGAHTLSVSDSAVLDSGERRLVFVETAPGRFEPRPVETGARSGGRIAILAGLRAGERVAVRANFLLDSESQLRGLLAGRAGRSAGSAGASPTP